MSKLLVLITSVIDTPNTPLSYSQIRSVYNRDERYEQTKYTIETTKKFFPEADIMMVECSNFENHPEQFNYLTSNVNFFLNLWERKDLHPNIFGLSKSLGEGTQTIEAFNYLLENNIFYDNLIKISGRYRFINRIDYDKYNKPILVGLNCANNYITHFYKLSFYYISLYKDFLISNMNNMINCIGYECLFHDFCKLYINDVDNVEDDINKLYIYGLMSPNGVNLGYEFNDLQ
jgi:hypothetical protein